MYKKLFRIALSILCLFFIFLSFQAFSKILNNQKPFFDEDNFEQTLSDDKKNRNTDWELKFCHYLILLYSQNIVSLNELKQYISSLEKGDLLNPLNCHEINHDKCQSTAYLIHRKGFENILKNADLIAIPNVISLLKTKVKDLNEISTSKENVKISTQNLEKLDFVLIEPGDYRIFYKLERVEGNKNASEEDFSIKSPARFMPMESLKEFFLKWFNIPIQKHLSNYTHYHFPKLKLDKSFEIATTLVTQKVFLHVMGYNPTYGALMIKTKEFKQTGGNGVNFVKNIAKDFSAHPLFGLEHNDPEKFYKNFMPVSRITISDVLKFVKKINEGVKNADPYILEILGDKKNCTYSIIQKDQYDYLKYHFFKQSSLYHYIPQHLRNHKENYQHLSALEDIVFLKDKVVLENDGSEGLSRGLAIGLESVSKVSPFNFDFFYYDTDGQLFYKNNAILKVIPAKIYHNSYYDHTIFMGGSHMQGFNSEEKVYANLPFEINGKGIYDLFYNKKIFIQSGKILLYETGDVESKNYYYEALFRGYPDELNFNEVTSFKKDKQGKFASFVDKSYIKKITLNQDYNVTDPALLSDNYKKINTYGAYDFHGLRLVRNCE